MQDLLLKGGTVIDPSQGLNEILDVAITAGRITQVAANLPDAEAARVIEVPGKVVAPGLIDIHAHLYQPGRNPVHPDAAGVWAGVTTVSDAGGSGPANFEEFCDVTLPQAKTRVYAYVSIFRDRSDLTPDESQIDVEGVVRTAREHPGLVKGVKCAVQARLVNVMGLKHVEAATAAARAAGIRVMLHIGDIGPQPQTPTPPKVVERAVAMLDPGDAITHIFTPLTGGALDFDGTVLPELKAAQARGVVMDSSCGDFNFGWKRAQDVMAQSLYPDTIGTDIDLQPGFGLRNNLMRGLLEYSTFFLHLGFPLVDVLRMATVNAAGALGIEDTAGSLAVGREADICVLDVEEGRWLLTDAGGESRAGAKALIPFLTIRSGEVIEPGTAPHPWGWGPPPLEPGLNWEAEGEVSELTHDADVDAQHR